MFFNTESCVWFRPNALEVSHAGLAASTAKADGPAGTAMAPEKG